MLLRVVHTVSQRLFTGIERAINAIAGDRCNPLYHLGAISFWMFWIVVASGFYVYAFYDTGVERTFESVERLTINQWFAGGVMRSLHRYASEAMVATMVLHLVRHFAFDRYRGYRAFSWVSGVVLLWLVYASGVNGYMLPWDRLAQFVVTATAEWFDVLPFFGGGLMRNFLRPENISDRFFSLLAFLHIGLPLAVLIVLWIHTQRVPRVATLPPRPIAIASGLALLVLAAVKPALSHSSADLTQLGDALAIDWWLLPALVAVDVWGPRTAWIVAGGATLLLLALPWLPPRRARQTVRLRFEPGRIEVPIRPHETILDAGLRQHLPIRFECRNGACGLCKATLLDGEVEFGAHQPAALTALDRSRRQILLCCATPVTDVDIELPIEASPTRRFQARVDALTRLTHDVMLVVLALPPGETIEFAAGQYIDVILPDGERRSYSFATGPAHTGRIELHIRLAPGGRFTPHVFADMRVGDQLTIEGPLGHAPIVDNDRPLILVAAATGFAPVKSILEHAFAAGFRRRMHLYWGVRRPDDLYCLDVIERWAAQHTHFSFTPVLSEPREDDHWTGRTGLVHEAILTDFPSLAGFEVYACGSVKMVEAGLPAFIAHGLDGDACFSDAFRPAAPAPRETSKA